MPSCWLIRESGEGDSRGLAGSEASETYGVIIDSPFDDPTAVVETQARPLDEHHPKWRHLVASGYAVHRTENPCYCEVTVTFQHPMRAQLRGWKIKVEYGNATERMFSDLDGKLIGPYAYHPVSEDDPRYPDALFYARAGDKDVTLWAGVTSPAQRSRVGLDVYVNNTVVHLSRVLTTMTFKRMRAIDTFKISCNANPFLAWLPNELLFFDAAVDQQESALEASERPGSEFTYPCDLIFLVNLQGWKHHRLRHTFRDDEGNESVVYWKNQGTGEPEPVEEDFRRYPERDFNQLLAMLEGGNQPPGVLLP